MLSHFSDSGDAGAGSAGGAFAGAAPVNPLLSQIAAFQAQAAAQAAAFAPPPQAMPPRSVGAGPGFFNFPAAPAAVSMPPGLGLGASTLSAVVRVGRRW